MDSSVCGYRGEALFDHRLIPLSFARSFASGGAEWRNTERSCECYGDFTTTIGLGPRVEEAWVGRSLLYCAIDFRVLRRVNLPPLFSVIEHEEENATARSRGSGVTKELPAHVRQGDVLFQEAHIDSVELHRAVLEDAVVLRQGLGDMRTLRDCAVRPCMVALNFVASFHEDSRHVDKVSVGSKQFAETVHVVVIPGGCELRDNVPNARLISRCPEGADGREKGQ